LEVVKFKKSKHNAFWRYAFQIKLFLFVSVFPQALFPLVRCHLVAFSFFTAWHIPLF
jgi:hypothetical protein